MFRFTIRDVLWLTVVVAVGVAWAVNWHLFSKETKHLNDVNADLHEEIAFLRRASVILSRQSAEWEESATEQRKRADFVSNEVHNRKALTVRCPDCGNSVAVPKSPDPWTPPAGSLWPDAPPQPAHRRRAPSKTIPDPYSSAAPLLIGPVNGDGQWSDNLDPLADYPPDLPRTINK
jgi:hypothetical protein